ncbi:MAG TPA: LytTR family DNA-binding domain-containing protein [Thermoanaerobaculia bacterium]|nr:LytTR family DNA-binding domain-containing protein [Thermoanaerobaculia bacterium]
MAFPGVPMGAVIVDDDPLGRMRIRELIEEREDVVVAAECVSPAEAVAAITELQPEIVFLDVEMPRGSGLSVLEALGEEDRPAVVFVTAHERYALDAFAVQAVDYLLKPFAREHFERSVQRACAYAMARSMSRARRAAASTVRGPFQERIAIRSASGIAFVRPADIDWLETAGNYVRLHVGAESHLVRGTMNMAEEQLDGRRFARTHRTTIVNVERIRQLVPSVGRDHLIVLRDGTRVRLGSQYRGNLRRLGFDF